MSGEGIAEWMKTLDQAFDEFNQDPCFERGFELLTACSCLEAAITGFLMKTGREESTDGE